MTPINKYSKVGIFPIADCVKDNVTELTWEGKTKEGFRNRLEIYTNFDHLNLNQISYTTSADGNPRVYLKPTQKQIDAATNSIDYRNSVNAMALCGYTDWRMPTFEELQWLATGATNNIDAAWFPNTSGPYWTSSGIEKEYPNQEVFYYAKFAVFGSTYGPVKWYSRSGSSSVRLVR